MSPNGVIDFEDFFILADNWSSRPLVMKPPPILGWCGFRNL